MDEPGTWVPNDEERQALWNALMGLPGYYGPPGSGMMFNPYAHLSPSEISDRQRYYNTNQGLYSIREYNRLPPDQQPPGPPGDAGFAYVNSPPDMLQTYLPRVADNLNPIAGISSWLDAWHARQAFGMPDPGFGPLPPIPGLQRPWY